MMANKYVAELNRKLEQMSALEALKAGLVQRVVPETTCGSYSPPEYRDEHPLVVCELEPGHDERAGHQAHLSSTIVSWA